MILLCNHSTASGCKRSSVIIFNDATENRNTKAPARTEIFFYSTCKTLLYESNQFFYLHDRIYGGSGEIRLNDFEALLAALQLCQP